MAVWILDQLFFFSREAFEGHFKGFVINEKAGFVVLENCRLQGEGCRLGAEFTVPCAVMTVSSQAMGFTIRDLPPVLFHCKRHAGDL